VTQRNGMARDPRYAVLFEPMKTGLLTAPKGRVPARREIRRVPGVERTQPIQMERREDEDI